MNFYSKKWKKIGFSLNGEHYDIAIENGFLYLIKIPIRTFWRTFTPFFYPDHIGGYTQGIVDGAKLDEKIVDGYRKRWYAEDGKFIKSRIKDILELKMNLDYLKQHITIKKSNWYHNKIHIDNGHGKIIKILNTKKEVLRFEDFLKENSHL